MTSDEYKRALAAACREYETLSAERAQLDERLERLQETIHSLTRLCGHTPTVPWGLADACRVVLRRAEKPMTPVEIRDRLTQIGFDVSHYSNELAAIHTTLKRFEESGEAKRVTGGGGERAYAAVRVRAVALVDLPKAIASLFAPPGPVRNR